MNDVIVVFILIFSLFMVLIIGGNYDGDGWMRWWQGRMGWGSDGGNWQQMKEIKTGNNDFCMYDYYIT